MKTNDEVLVSAGGVLNNARVKAYANRLEVAYPRVATFGLTKKRETYAYKSIQGVTTKGGSVTIKLGTLSTRTFNVGRGNAKKIAALIQAGM